MGVLELNASITSTPARTSSSSLSCPLYGWGSTTIPPWAFICSIASMGSFEVISSSMNKPMMSPIVLFTSQPVITVNSGSRFCFFVSSPPRTVPWSTTATPSRPLFFAVLIIAFGWRSESNEYFEWICRSNLILVAPGSICIRN